jgi:hypothetical protein
MRGRGGESSLRHAADFHIDLILCIYLILCIVMGRNHSRARVVMNTDTHVRPLQFAHTNLPNRPETINDGPKLLIACALYQRPAILLLNDASGICLEEIRTLYLHSLEYHGSLVRRPHAEVMIVRSNVAVVPFVFRGASEGGLGDCVPTHDRR